MQASYPSPLSRGNVRRGGGAVAVRACSVMAPFVSLLSPLPCKHCSLKAGCPSALHYAARGLRSKGLYGLLPTLNASGDTLCRLLARLRCAADDTTCRPCSPFPLHPLFAAPFRFAYQPAFPTPSAAVAPLTRRSAFWVFRLRVPLCRLPLGSPPETASLRGSLRDPDFRQTLPTGEPHKRSTTNGSH